ncbi:UNVERIFIED_CONTAM: putative mitochondrial protein [Sesamum calycinum]|uniref:Mitochondrial protein n=1 Tax=Sesamum calycinum TaxID=2727403 RepID=A0AAW2J9F8_9LAMI
MGNGAAHASATPQCLNIHCSKCSLWSNASPNSSQLAALHEKHAIQKGIQLHVAGGRTQGEIKEVAIARGAPRTSHLLLVDDTIIFGIAREEAMLAIKRILRLFGQASEQEVNFEKSSMVVSRNVGDMEKRRMANILGVMLVPRHEKYLGLPTIVGKARGYLFQGIKDRVWCRVQGWNAKLLSQAGRGVLIKAVLQSIPTNVMSCFRLPDYFLHEIEVMMANFWWHSKGERCTHWVGWSEMCKPKEEGGLGFRELKTFNRALLAKQGWRLIKKPDSLVSQTLKAKYFPGLSFLDAQLGSRPSLT